MATQNQALVSTALQQLKLNPIPAEGGKVGGPQQFQITKETAAFVKEAEGKIFVVTSTGELTEE